MCAAVADKPALLDALLHDSNNASALWQPTAYWRNYTGRIEREIRRVGLSAFQSNHRICKGYGPGSTPEPFGPVAGWKSAVWRALVRLPVFDRIIAEYRRTIAAEHAALRRAQIRYARFALDAVARQFADLRIPRGLDNGAPDDAFQWNGAAVAAAWVEHLCRVADFYARVEPASVASIIEIGPGVGFSTLAHRALNRHLRVVVNVDIAPPLYVSTQFLRASAEFEVKDYLDARAVDRIAVRAAGDRPHLYQLPPWMLPKVEGQFDYFFNAFSFQEMEREVCENYARELMARVSRGVLLHSSMLGHDPGAGGQRAPVTMEFIARLFATEFPHKAEVPGLWTRLYEHEPAVLLKRDSN